MTCSFCSLPSDNIAGFALCKPCAKKIHSAMSPKRKPKSKTGEEPCLSFHDDSWKEMTGLLRWTRDRGSICSDWAEPWTEHFDPDDILREAEKFWDYYVSGKGADKATPLHAWKRTWDNWMQNKLDWRRR